MLLDARDFPNRTDFTPDVCVVGAGAAGITLALALRGSGLQVLLLEAGGLLLEQETQALYQGKSVGLPYYALDFTRLRYFGGTTNHWTGWSRPLDPIDFEVRPGVPDSGWPITRAELDPYYERAQELLELGPGDYSAEGWAEREGGFLLPLDPALATTALWQLSPPTRFGGRYRQQLERDPGLRVVLHANAVRLTTGRDGKRVEGLLAVTLEGKRIEVRPRLTVLALGALENPRLLLASTEGHPHGLGNQHDVVGRYFMEHPHANLGVLLTSAEEDDLSFYSDVYRPQPGPPPALRCALAIPAERMRREGLLGFSATLEPRIESAPVGRSLRDAVASLTRDLQRAHARAPYQLFGRLEQAPSRLSRVYLGEGRDALGMRRLVIDWQLDELTRQSARRGMELLAAAVGKARLGRLYSFVHARDPRLPARWPDVIGGHHHMGTTRMGEDPHTSVVDRDLRVHGIENLYLAGSSVFATSGFSNPTLTIVALSLRLAEHLQEVAR